MHKKILYYSKKPSLADKFLDILFPPHCVFCGKHIKQGNICDECFSKIEFLEFPLIKHIGKTYFYAITKYEGLSASIVKLIKFKKHKVLISDVSSIVAYFLMDKGLNSSYISYVPMTVSEEKSRGFNQSKLIAISVAKLLNMNLFNDIYKLKDTPKQIGLPAYKRRKNLKGAFAVKDTLDGSIVVVDDVYTTGSTAFEISHELSKKVAGNIYFVAFSRKII